MSQAILTVSIVTFKQDRAVLINTLTSLGAAVDELVEKKGYFVELHVINNGSCEELRANDVSFIKSKNLQVEFFQNEKNVGYGVAHNQSILQSNSLFHLILNPDVVLASDSLLRGLQYLSENSEVSALSPYGEDEQGHKLFLCKRYPTVLTLCIRGFMPQFVRGLFNRQLNAYELGLETLESDREQSPFNVELMSGCFMLCRQKSLKKIGGFSKDFFLYFEDFDLSMRLSETGVLTYYPAMKIIHLGGGAARKGLEHIKLFMRSAVKFFNTYGWKFF